MSDDHYLDEVKRLESKFKPYAFHAWDKGLTLEGEPVVAALDKAWRSTEGRSRLRGRTPATLERDRILFSPEYRLQDDKHHILLVDTERVVRNYTSQAVRCAHVARAVAGRLGLNSELAEAIALGTKVGAVPFLHVGKEAVDRWVKKQIRDTDARAADRNKTPVQTELGYRSGEDGERDALTLPSWISSLQSPSVRREVENILPWAAGSENLKAYGSGQQSYWHLTLNPFLLEVRSESTPNLAQTMYGIWRHSLERMTTDNFAHRVTPNNAKNRTLESGHLTHEAIVVRYADDITWAIENLSEASRAALKAGRQATAFQELSRRSEDLALPLVGALGGADPGRIYSYFIDDLVSASGSLLEDSDPTQPLRETEHMVKLSNDADNALSIMKTHLSDFVFEDDRIRRRNDALISITETTLDVLYEANDSVLRKYVGDRAQSEGWHSKREVEQAMERLNDPICRIQACVSVFVTMSDRDVYEFIGLGE